MKDKKLIQEISENRIKINTLVTDLVILNSDLRKLKSEYKKLADEISGEDDVIVFEVGKVYKIMFKMPEGE